MNESGSGDAANRPFRSHLLPRTAPLAEARVSTHSEESSRDSPQELAQYLAAGLLSATPQNAASALRRLAGAVGVLTPGVVHELQRLYGNRFVGQLLGASEGRIRELLNRPQEGGTSTPPTGQDPDKESYVLSRKVPGDLRGMTGESLLRLLGPGEPLGADLRQPFEQSLVTSLADVRIHKSDSAYLVANAIGASAFAFEHHIGFSPGAWEPSSAEGLQLLAHELAHVSQFQRAGGINDHAEPLQLSRTDGTAEREAEGFSQTPPVLASAAERNPVAAAPTQPTLFRQQARPKTEEAQKLLQEGENLRWVGPENDPQLVLRRSWLTLVNGVPRGTRKLSGRQYPAVLRQVMVELIKRYPWAEPNRDEALARVAELGLIIPRSAWAEEEINCGLEHGVFQVIGLPPSDPVQIYRAGSGVEIYADTRTLYAQGAATADIEGSKRPAALRISAALQAYFHRQLSPSQHLTLIEILQRALPSKRQTFVFPLNERQLRIVFGDDVLAQPRAEGGAGLHGAVLQLSGGSYELPPSVPRADQEKIRGVLTSLFSALPAAAPPAERRLVLGQQDVATLLKLASHPNREKVLALLRDTRREHGITGIQSISELIEITLARIDELKAAQALGYTLPAAAVQAEAPIAGRPVHGRILNKSGALVPKMKGRFEFQTLDQVDALRVPHVSIRWFAIRQNAAPGSPPIRTELTDYIEVRADSVFNDREFTVAFDRVGLYEIHAFVNHNFYLPAHFSIPVEVKTEHERLTEQEIESGAPAFGEAGPARVYRFRDVVAENLWVEAGLKTAAQVATPLPLPIGQLRPDESLGLRSEGRLSRETMAIPGGSVALGQRQLTQQIRQLDQLIQQYRAAGQEANADIIGWAQSYRDRLNTTRQRLVELTAGQNTRSIAVQGNYVTREAGSRSGPLKLAAWFDFDPRDNGTYKGHLFDHSQLVRNEDFHFRASDTNYENMMEQLFFAISRTYPNGTMSFSFQLYAGLTATDRFVRYERVTDTLLKDVRSVVFSEAASLVVNIAATILAVFPPTMPIGIGISIAYNGANALSNFTEAASTDTIRASNYVDVGLVVLDVIPVLGRASRALRVAQTTYRVLNATQYVGMAYIFTEQGYAQVQQLRGGLVTQLAELRSRIQLLQQTNLSDPSLPELRRQAQEMERSLRMAAVEVFSELALHQGVTLATIHAVNRAAAAHFERGPGTRSLPAGQPEPGPETGRAAAVEGGIERPAAEAVRVTRPAASIDRVLQAALPPDLQSRVTVHRGPPPSEHEVRVYYSTDGLGLIREIHIAAGPNALPHHIDQHVPTVRILDKYRGVGGALRILFERLTTLLARHRAAIVPGSPLFNASLEIEKLPRIIQERATVLQQRGLDPEIRRDYEVEIEHLNNELERFRRVLDQFETELSQDFIAATVPRSNQRGFALTGLTATDIPGHYFYEPSPGTFELRRYVSSNDPPLRLKFEKGRWSVEPRPEKPRSSESFLQVQLGSYAEPRSDRPAIEALAKERFAHAQTDEAGVAVTRRWADALDELHRGAGDGGDALVNRLIDKMGSSSTYPAYERFRRAIREAMVEQALAQPHPPGKPDERVLRIRQLLASIPDPGSQGALFSEFRKALAAREGSPLKSMQPIPNAAVALPNGRFADGAVTSIGGPAGTPPKGKYLAEDKSGPGAFKANQAEAYSDQLKNNKGVIRTNDGASYDGIIYTFDSYASAKLALAKIEQLHPNIHVGYFDSEGSFVWAR